MTDRQELDGHALDEPVIPNNGTGVEYESPLTVSQSEIVKKEPHQHMAQSQKNRALIQLLRSWREGDEQEQRNTWEYLKQALDEDRLSERKLFP